MADWIVCCNGGPDGCIVSTEAPSLGKACGTLEFMMKQLGATLGQIERKETTGKEKP